MMPTTHLEKLYGYKGTYNKMYVVRLNNRQIVRIQDVRFYKEDPFIKRIDQEALPKTVFDKETKRLTLREVIFGSGDRLPSSRTSGPSQLQQTEAPAAGEIPAEEQIDLSSFSPTPQKLPDEAKIGDIESKSLLVPSKKEEIDPTSGNIQSRHPRYTAVKIVSYNVTNKKDFITNNKGKALMYIY